MTPVRTPDSSFDSTKKSDWFYADFEGVWSLTIFLATASALFSGFLGFWIYQFTGFDIGIPVTQFVRVKMGMPMLHGFLLLMGFYMLAAFYVVFVRRYNPDVAGQRRQFRYFCRWI